MRRRSLLGLLVVALMMTVATPVAWGSGGGAQAQIGFESGGIGLTVEEWESIHGAGDVGQNYVTYENDRYYVQFAGGAISFLELGWENEGGIDAADATAEIEGLLPADATILETFSAPPTGGGPVGLQVDRYQSETLVDRYPDASTPPTGGIVVIYQQTRAEDRMEPYVTRASLAIGTDPIGR
jgi:hypothetical protein